MQYVQERALLEVQQSSDITYRLYDYNRLHNGELRELHVEKGLDALKIPSDPLLQKPLDTYFKYSIEEVETEETFIADQHGDYVFIMEGKGLFNEIPVAAGDFIMVSSLDTYNVIGNIKFQITQI